MVRVIQDYRSLMLPFGTAHMSFYSPFIKKLCLSCTVFEIWRVICRNSQDLPTARVSGTTAPQYLAVHWSPVSETASRQHLRSAASHQVAVPPHRRTMSVGRLLSLVRRRGTHCQDVYVIPLLVLLFLPVF